MEKFKDPKTGIFYTKTENRFFYGSGLDIWIECIFEYPKTWKYDQRTGTTLRREDSFKDLIKIS